MRSRRRAAILVATVVVAVAVIVGVVSVAAAGSSETLPSVTSEELLTKMARGGLGSQAVSGEISWQNNLFGNLEMSTDLAQMPAQSPLLSSGSGRVWVSDEGMRVESQGSGGDRIAAVSRASRLAWTYDSASNTAHGYELSGDAVESRTPSPSMTATLAPAVIGTYLERLAPYATVVVTGQVTVAGRPAYVLRMTPVAQDTALGSVEVSIDGETMRPLRLEIFAKGGSGPVLQFGFDSISYERVDPGLYEFAPPEGAKVTTEAVGPAGMRARAGEDATASHHAEALPSGNEGDGQKLLRRALLTIEEAQDLVNYELAKAREYGPRPFRWAYVFEDGGPLTAAGRPLFGVTGSEQTNQAPTSALLYGSGFGAITLMQTKTTPELTKQLEQLPVLVQTTEGAGASMRSMFTPLGGVVIWQQDGTTLVAAGMVTQADLEAFVRAVR